MTPDTPGFELWWCRHQSVAGTLGVRLHGLLEEEDVSL